MFAALGGTLARVVAAFALAMAVGSALGYAMGRNAVVDRAADPLDRRAAEPAGARHHRARLYLGRAQRGGRNRRGCAQQAAQCRRDHPRGRARARRGARRDGAGVPVFAAHAAAPRRAPQLAPFFAAATRSGLSLVWKIVLVVELLGRPNGVGFEINIAFQLFDVALLLAYALPFTAIMLIIETLPGATL